jgi:hypothetical protein
MQLGKARADEAEGLKNHPAAEIICSAGFSGEKKV